MFYYFWLTISNENKHQQKFKLIINKTKKAKQKWPKILPKLKNKNSFFLDYTEAKQKIVHLAKT